jgi:biotin synthase-related radical SAM superfamily protein
MGVSSWRMSHCLLCAQQQSEKSNSLPTMLIVQVTPAVTSVNTHGFVKRVAAEAAIALCVTSHAGGKSSDRSVLEI